MLVSVGQSKRYHASEDFSLRCQSLEKVIFAVSSSLLSIKVVGKSTEARQE